MTGPTRNVCATGGKPSASCCSRRCQQCPRTRSTNRSATAAGRRQEWPAHRLFWEAEERAAIEEHLGGAFPSLLDFPTRRIDSTNAAAVASLGDRRLSALIRALQDLRGRTVTLVERIPDADLNSQGNPARILLGVALEHDREHRRELESKFGPTSPDE